MSARTRFALSGPGDVPDGREETVGGRVAAATRDGARDEMRVLGALGLASSRLSVEGPVGENVSYLLNGRRTYIDGVTLALSRAGFISQHVPYSFQDVHGKVTADLGGVRRLSVSGYLNTESLERFDQDTTHALELAWGNIAVSAHYRDRIGDAGILDANLGSSHFTSDLLSAGTRHVGLPVVPGAAQPVDTLAFGTGAMSETRADLRATWHLARSTLVTGVQATRYSGIHDFELADEFISDEGFFVSSFTLDEQRWRLAAYSSVEIPLAGGLSTRAGLRADRFEGLATTLAPFAELGYEASWWDLRVSAARSHQMLASARDEEAVGASFLAYDLLVPVARAPVPRNTEVSVGWQAARGGLRFRLDAYARMLDHLRLPPLGKRPSIRTALADPSRWEVASGTARGIETTTSWISDSGFSMLGTYRWARVQRTVGLRKYTPRFHREHELEVGTAYAPGASSWSARFSLRSGQPETEVLALAAANEYHRGEAELVVLGGEYNAGRLPHYMRIDIGWRRDSPVSWFGGGTLTPYVSVANLFSLPNVVGWRVRQDFGDLGSRGRQVRGAYPGRAPPPPAERGGAADHGGAGRTRLDGHVLRATGPGVVRVRNASLELAGSGVLLRSRSPRGRPGKPELRNPGDGTARFLHRRHDDARTAGDRGSGGRRATDGRWGRVERTNPAGIQEGPGHRHADGPRGLLGDSGRWHGSGPLRCIPPTA